jgi:hypothetical protein
MKKISITLFLFLCAVCGFTQKSMQLEDAEKNEKFQKLDSLYKSGIHTDTTIAVFKNQEAYIAAYQEFIFQLADFLAKNNFKWEKEVRCFNKVYFSKEGTVDYFLYNFKEGQLTDEQKATFANLLQRFIEDTKFGLQADVPFSQCSPVKYRDL